MDNIQLNEEFVADFLQRHTGLNDEDIEVLAANAIKSSPSVKGPILGLGNDIEGVIEFVKKTMETVKSQLCNEYCTNDDFRKALAVATEIQAFLLVTQKAVKLFPGIPDLGLDTVDTETSLILTLLMFGSQVKKRMDIFCRCPPSK